MSKVVDQRVVQMQFDNSHFEKNVSTTMSTLDKFKQKLNLTGATKGLESVGAAAKNINIGGIGQAVETVTAKFSALQVIGVTALSNITNSAVNAGKQMVKSLTIDPVKTGFNEYELKMGSIQTIMASTGESLETVNQYLNELNEYSDKTIYSFSDMTQNIGKFTNAGVKLEDAVLAIKGISNEAALSGANANEASRAMYNFAQALSAGYVKLIDWKSIENANMATVGFKQALIDAAVAAGTLTKTADGMYETMGGTAITATQNFNDSLQDQWMTTEVLISTLKDYADETTDIGKKATAAAQDVKTWSMLVDTLKESVQSGWAQTWELVFGDFEQAKSLFTNLSKSIGGFLDKMSDARNNLLKGALTSKWDQLIEKVNEAGISTESFNNKLKETASENGYAVDELIEKHGSLAKAFAAGEIKGSVIIQTLKKFVGLAEGGAAATAELAGQLDYYQKVVDEVWLGKWGLMQARMDALTEAGYNAAFVQKLVNMTVDEHRLTVEDLMKAQAELTDTELESMGYTKEQVKAIRELAKAAEESGTPINELIKSLEKPDGRTLLIDSFKNAVSGLVSVIKAVGNAWKEIFPPMTSDQLYKIIEGFNKLTKHLVVNDKTANNIKRTFKGLFALLDIVLTLVAGPLKIAFKLLTSVLEVFDLDIWSVTAVIGDAIVKFRDWLDAVLNFTAVFKKLKPYMVTGGKAIASFFVNAGIGLKEWYAGLKEADNIPKYIIDTLVNGFKKAGTSVGNAAKSVGATVWKWLNIGLGKLGIDTSGFVNGIKKMVDSIKNWFAELKKSDNIPRDIILGLIKGLQNGVSTVGSAVIELGKMIIEKIKGVLGIHSPSKVFIEIGSYIIQGLVQGLKYGAKFVLEAVKNIGSRLVEVVKTIDLGTIFAGLLATGIFVAVGKVLKILDNITSPFAQIGDVIDTFGDNLGRVMKSTSKVMNSFSNAVNAYAIKTIATSILMLVGAIVVLSLIPTGKVWSSIGAIAALAVIMGVLTIAMNKFTKSEGGNALESGKFGVLMATLAVSLLIMAGVVAILGKMDPDTLKQGITAIGFFGAFIIILAAVSKYLPEENVDKFTAMLGKLSIALLLMAVVVRILGGMDQKHMEIGCAALIAFGGIIGVLMWATKFIGKGEDIEKFGKAISSIGLAFLMMAVVVRLLGGMDATALKQGTDAIFAFSLVMMGLMLATRLLAGGDKQIEQFGKAIGGIGAAFLMMALSVAILGRLDVPTMVKGGIAIGVFAGIIVGLMAATRLLANGEKDMAAFGKMMMSVGVAIMLMAASMAILGLLPIKMLIKGGLAVAVIAGIIVGLMAATKLLGPSYGKEIEQFGKVLTSMAIAVGVIAVALIALSFVPFPKLAASVGALVAVMGMFAVLIKSTQKMTTSVGPLIVMTAAIAVLTAALFVLSKTPWQSLIASAIALSGLILVMAAAMRIIANTKTISAPALLGVATMTLVMAALGLVLLMLKGLSIESAVSAVIGIGALMLVMAATLLIISNMKTVSAPALIAMAAMTVIVALLGGILALFTNITNVDAAITMAMAISTLLLTMTAVCVVLAAASSILAGALTGIGILALVIVAAGALFIAIGALMEYVPGLEEFLDKGIAVLSKIAYGLGQVVGSIVGGLVDGVLSFLPQVGTYLSDFMTNAQVFIDGCKQVDESVLIGAGCLAGAILALTVADLIAGISSFIQGGSSFAKMGLDLSMFMMGAQYFIEQAKQLNADMMAGVKALAETVLILTAANILEGLTSWLTGGDALSDFATELPYVGTGIRGLLDNLGTFGEAEALTVTAAAEAVKVLASAAQKIPNTGGLLADLVGDNTMGTFAADFPLLGIGIRGLLDNLGTFSEAEVTTVNAAASAVKTLAAAAKEIPNAGGLLADLVGDNTMSSFAAEIPLLGIGLKGLLDSLQGCLDDGSAHDTIKAAASAVKTLAKASSEIPNTGGLLASLVGDNTMGKFATDFPKLGTGLKGLITNLGGCLDDEASREAIKAAASATKTLAKVSSDIPNAGGLLAGLVGDNTLGKFASEFPKVGTGIKKLVSNMGDFSSEHVQKITLATEAIEILSNISKTDLDVVPKFADKLPNMGTDIKKFVSNMGDSSGISTAISNTKSILSLTSYMKQFTYEHVSKFGDALKSLGTKTVTTFVNEFSSSGTYAKFKQAGSNMIESLVAGASTKASSVTGIISKLCAAGVQQAKDYWDLFYSAGKYLVAGFSSGITVNTFKAEAAAAAMADAAYEAAKDTLDINSPSKVFRAMGTSVPEGFAQGIDKLSGMVKSSSVGMASTAIDTVKSSISRIAAAASADIDTQPRIRPVLDLSDVKAGAGAIGDMFNATPSVGVLANVGTISSMMNGYSQNGGNDDVVSALEKLGKNLGGSSGNTYNINGITYDDGSNIAGAIEAIVRAARIERRS